MAVKHDRNWKQSTGEYAAKEKQVVVKVRKTGWVTKGEKVLYSLISLLLISAALYIVSYSSSIDTLNRDLQSIEQSVADQQVVNEGLLFEVRELSRPERITKIAKENGMKIQDAEVKRVQLFNN